MSQPSMCLDQPTVQAWSHQRQVDHLREIAEDRHEENPVIRVPLSHHPLIPLLFLLHQRADDQVIRG